MYHVGLQEVFQGEVEEFNDLGVHMSTDSLL